MSETPKESAPAEPPPAEQPAEAQPAQPSRRIRVAWIAGRDTLDRYGSTLQPLAVGSIDELVDLVVLCPLGSDTRDLPSPPVEVMRYGRMRHPRLHPRRLEALAAELSARKVELLHALDSPAADLARRLAHRVELNYIVSSYSIGDGRRLGTLDSRAAGVLAASGPIQRDLLEHHVAAAQKVHLVRPGVYQTHHANCFKELGRSAAIVAGGDLNHFGAFDTVLRSFAELRAKKHDCVFFLIGSGRAERQLRARSEKLALRGDLTFVDRQPASRMPDLLKAADIYISPVPGRSFDMEALLAMAAGVPVVSAGNDAADFLLPFRTARLFKPGDSADLTSKLTFLLGDRASARSLAESALGYLRENHSPARMVVWLANIYRETRDAP